jgi:hypothetical protein
VRRQIIHHHDIAGGEFGNEDLLDVIPACVKADSLGIPADRER